MGFQPRATCTQLLHQPCIRSTIESSLSLSATCDPLADADACRATLRSPARRDQRSKAHYSFVADSLHSTECSLRFSLTSCRSHVLLSLSCRELSLPCPTLPLPPPPPPVLPTHDREDPLANVNARITVFIAQPAVPVPPSLPLPASPFLPLSPDHLFSTHKYIRTMRR
jgi:hypothetical protein